MSLWEAAPATSNPNPAPAGEAARFPLELSFVYILEKDLQSPGIE